MLQKLLDHSPDLQKLVDEGYELEIRGSFALVHHVPYVTASKEIDYGTLVSSLTLNGEATTKPNDHIVGFIGNMPCDRNGNEISSIVLEHRNQNWGNDIIVQHRFSNKPTGGYSDYYEKFKRYIEIISAPAIASDNTVRVKTYRSWDTDIQTVFKYKDTNSSKAGIGAIAEKLSKQRIAIIGLGGSGSYILDFLAKTPVEEIHLFDGDIFMQHNAFRAPGAATKEMLSSCIMKVEYFKNIYSNMHTKIVSHPYFIDEMHLSELIDMTFVFVSMDCTSEKQDIVAYLVENNICFIDTGIGLTCTDEMIGGQIRTTTVVNKENSEKQDIVQKYIPLDVDQEEDVYKSNIQIAELNALNAVMAVISFKKQIGFYQDFRCDINSVYSINVGEIINAD